MPDQEDDGLLPCSLEASKRRSLSTLLLFAVTVGAAPLHLRWQGQETTLKIFTPGK